MINEEIIDNLEKNKYLNEKIQMINKKINELDLKDAYFKTAAILEYINIKYIKKKYKIDMSNSSVIRIIKFYKDTDKKLYDNMININAEYNQIDENNIMIEDIEYLISIIDSIYEYMTKDSGVFI